MKKQIDRPATQDQAIENERCKIAKLQLNVQQEREGVRKGEEEMEPLAYRALADGEPQAQAELSRVEEALIRSQSRARSAEIALQASQSKLEALIRERDGMYREQKRQEYAAQAVELIHADGEEMESILMTMSTVRESIGARLKRMEAIAQEAGIDAQRVHNRVRQNLTHCIQQRAEFQTVWMSRENRETFKQPIATLLQATLKILVPELENEGERKIA